MAEKRRVKQAAGHSPTPLCLLSILNEWNLLVAEFIGDKHLLEGKPEGRNSISHADEGCLKQ